MFINVDKNIELSIPGTSRVVTLAFTRKSSLGGDSLASSGKRNRKLRYALGGLLGIVVIGLYVYYHRTEIRRPEDSRTAQEELVGGRYAEDGSYLADLGSLAEDVYNLGPTEPEQ